MRCVSATTVHQNARGQPAGRPPTLTPPIAPHERRVSFDLRANRSLSWAWHWCCAMHSRMPQLEGFGLCQSASTPLELRRLDPLFTRARFTHPGRQSRQQHPVVSAFLITHPPLPPDSVSRQSSFPRVFKQTPSCPRPCRQFRPEAAALDLSARTLKTQLRPAPADRDPSGHFLSCRHRFLSSALRVVCSRFLLSGLFHRHPQASLPTLLDALCPHFVSTSALLSAFRARRIIDPVDILSPSRAPGSRFPASVLVEEKVGHIGPIVPCLRYRSSWVPVSCLAPGSGD